MRLNLLIINALALFLIGASPSEQVGADKTKHSPQEKNATTKEQPEQIKPTPFQTSVLEMLRAIQSQQGAAYQQDQANQETWSSPSVRVNMALVLVGIIYTAFAALQWAAIRRQADISEKTLALSNRPRLRVRSCFVTNWDLEADDRIFVHFKVINYGGSDAHLIDSNLTLLLAHVSSVPDLPMLPEYETTDPRNRIASPERIFRVGEEFRHSRAEPIPDEIGLPLLAGHLRFYIMGYLTYRGSIGNTYTTAFCRRLETELKDVQGGKVLVPTRFIPVDNPDYEYED